MISGVANRKILRCLWVSTIVSMWCSAASDAQNYNAPNNFGFRSYTGGNAGGFGGNGGPQPVNSGFSGLNAKKAQYAASAPHAAAAMEQMLGAVESAQQGWYQPQQMQAQVNTQANNLANQRSRVLPQI